MTTWMVLWVINVCICYLDYSQKSWSSQPGLPESVVEVHCFSQWLAGSSLPQPSLVGRWNGRCTVCQTRVPVRGRVLKHGTEWFIHTVKTEGYCLRFITAISIQSTNVYCLTINHCTNTCVEILPNETIADAVPCTSRPPKLPRLSDT